MKARRPKGEGTIVQRADGRWALIVELPPLDGKRRRRAITAKTRAEALRKAADLRARGGGSIAPRARGTVGEMVDSWLETEVQPNLAPTTHRSYEQLWRLHASPRIGSRRLEDFSVEHADALIAAMRKDGASASLVQHVIVVLHRAFARAIRRRAYSRANPFDLVERPRHRVREGRALDASEARRFLSAASADRFEALWIVLVTAGLRIGEALALEWSDIDLGARTLTIRRAFVEVSGYIEISPGKTKGSRRQIELGDLAVAALRRRHAAAAAEDHRGSLVFPTMRGTPMRQSNLRRSHFEPILARAELGKVRLHDLRHSMTSLAIAEGVPVKTIADRLGHTTTRLVQDRYGHILPGMQRAAADALERAITEPKSKPSRARRTNR